MLLRVTMDFTYPLKLSLHMTKILMPGPCNNIFEVSGAYNVGQAEVVSMSLETTCHTLGKPSLLSRFSGKKAHHSLLSPDCSVCRMSCMPYVLTLPEVSDGTTAVPVDPLLCTAICRQIVGERQNDAHAAGTRCGHHIVQALRQAL